jgi:hypothetical protein
MASLEALRKQWHVPWILELATYVIISHDPLQPHDRNWVDLLLLSLHRPVIDMSSVHMLY